MSLERRLFFLKYIRIFFQGFRLINGSTEPILRKLKEKWPEAKITYYTAKTDAIKYFINFIEMEFTSFKEQEHYKVARLLYNV